MAIENIIAEKVSHIANLLSKQNHCLAVAESCTGGMLAQVLTAQAGSSQWFEGGFISYSNRAKQQLLNISPELLLRYQAVSEQTAKAMAEGALKGTKAHYSLSTTGIAGPNSDQSQEEVGTVWCGLANALTGLSKAKCAKFKGDRHAVRQKAVLFALECLLEELTKSSEEM